MFVDELSGICPVVQIGGHVAALHADGNVVPHFKMEVGGIHSEIGANCADLLPPLDDLAGLDHDLVEVAVEGVDVFDLAGGGIAVGMTGEHDVTPTGADVIGQGDDAIGDCVNGASEVGVTAAAAVPVLTKVLGGSQAETARLVVAIRIGFSDGKIKAVR